MTENFDGDWLVDVVRRDMMDSAHQALHTQKWLIVYPNAEIEYFETEDEACARQVELGFIK